MAPEQIEGSAPTPAVDVYASGVVLYELLCGKLPYPPLGDPLAELYQHVNADPTPLLARAPQLPRSLGEVTARALQRDPAERYPSAAELADAVAAAAATEWGPNWAQDAGVPLRTTARRGAVPVADAVTSTLRGTRVLKERDGERAALEAAIEAARAGDGAGVLIAGPAGIGKTALLSEAASLAERAGLRSLRAHATDAAWGAVRQLFEREARDLAADPHALSGAARLALPIIASERPPDVGDDEVDRELALYHGLHGLLSDLAARRPLILTVDDLHEIDAPSLRFLTYLAGRLEGMHVAFVAAARTAAGAAEPTALVQLAAEPSMNVLRPGALAVASVEALARERLGRDPSSELVLACMTLTEGHPLVVDQLLSTPIDDIVGTDPELLPRAVTSLLRARLEREPDAVAELARAVAVLGDGVKLGAAAAEAGLSAPASTEHARRLADMRLLRTAPPFGFRHPLLRAAMLAVTPPALRSRRDRKAAPTGTALDAALPAVTAHPREEVVHEPGAVRVALGPDPVAAISREDVSRTAPANDVALAAGAALALTMRERRISRLAADGLSDAAIAELLFVSTVAVEHQLASICAKLGLGAREELAGHPLGGAAEA